MTNSVLDRSSRTYSSRVRRFPNSACRNVLEAANRLAYTWSAVYAPTFDRSAATRSTAVKPRPKMFVHSRGSGGLKLLHALSTPRANAESETIVGPPVPLGRKIMMSYTRSAAGANTRKNRPVAIRSNRSFDPHSLPTKSIQVHVHQLRQ